MIEDVIESAQAEARRRGTMSDRDVSGSVAHVERALSVVCRDEGLTPESWFSGGAGMPTLAVTTADGIAAVLKLDQPGRLDVQAQIMLAANGRGYARVLRWDPSRGALLTERLGDTLWTEARSVEAQTAAILPVLREAWDVPIEVGSPFVGKAAGLRTILADLGPRYGSGHPRAMARAAGYATGLATAEQPEVVCHGDPHAGNVLRRGRGWALIDPDGFVGERAYDLDVVLRDACGEIVVMEASEPGSGVTLLREACRQLADLADADPERVWRWGFVERVTTGLYLRRFGHASESATFLDTAAQLAG